jgi:hypothetical protein
VKGKILDGAPGETRTPDPLVRSQMLYPAELRARKVIIPRKPIRLTQVVKFRPGLLVKEGLAGVRWKLIDLKQPVSNHRKQGSVRRER